MFVFSGWIVKLLKGKLNIACSSPNISLNIHSKKAVKLLIKKKGKVKVSGLAERHHEADHNGGNPPDTPRRHHYSRGLT